MIDISLAGLGGAVVGTLAAAVIYHVFIGMLERRMRERGSLQTAEDRDRMDMRLSLMRRTVLTVDLFAFAAAGYWLGQKVAG